MPTFSEDWNKEPALSNNSCYNYALDKQSTGKKGKNLNPGDRNGKPVHIPFKCKPDVVDALKRDLDVKDPVDKDKQCPDKCWKIACLRAPKAQPDADLHFYRQDEDGTWSHKRGSEKATNRGTDGNPITDPEKDGKSLKPYSYSEVCGYFCVCPDNIKAIEVAMLAPGVGAQAYCALNLGKSLELTVADTRLYVPAGKLVMLYDFAEQPDGAPIGDGPSIIASLFSLRPNPDWNLSRAQAGELAGKVRTILPVRPEPSAKPFGGFCIRGLGVEGFEPVWVTDGAIYGSRVDGNDWRVVDTLGISDTIRADFRQRFPAYAEEAN